MDTNMALSSEKLSREPYLIEKDGDYVVDDENRLPFEHKKALGSGYSAVVDKVEDTRSNMVFARKVVKFRHGRFRKRTEELYRDEVDIIRRLKTHHHVIRLFATYKTKEGGSLLLQPVADEGNLEEYLGKYSEATVFLDPTSIAMMTRVLKQAFGCLATGLAFIHERGIRHKDIKSSNILIYKGRIIYTDFGAAKDTIKDGECTTEGKPEFLTRKYCAPEVLEHDKRNYAADVYSLGCIFVDILFAMSPLVDHEQKPGQHFSDIMDDVHLELLSAKVPATLSFLSNLTVSMTMREPTKRPESPVIVTELCCNPEICCTACRQNVPGVDTLSMSGGNTRKWSGLPNPSLGLKASSSYDMSQPEWNAEFQRYLYKYWDERQQRDYWTHHVEGQGWVFFAWCPTHLVHAQPLRQGVGATIQGTYTTANPQTPESLDPSFCVRDPSYFQVGKLFAILFTEPAGANAARAVNLITDYNSELSAFSKVQYGEFAYTQVRRFVVVRQRRGYCYAVPIFRYGMRATLKHGVIPNEHAIAYSYGYSPQLLPGEQELSKGPICIVMNTGEKPLSITSRIYFGIHYPIQYNVKVKDLGYVLEDCIPDLLGYWNEENGNDTQ